MQLITFYSEQQNQFKSKYRNTPADNTVTVILYIHVSHPILLMSVLSL